MVNMQCFSKCPAIEKGEAEFLTENKGYPEAKKEGGNPRAWCLQGRKYKRFAFLSIVLGAGAFSEIPEPLRT